MELFLKSNKIIKQSFFLISLLFLISCKEYKEVTITGIDSFHVNKITLENIDAELNLKIKNPNSFGFFIYRSEFDLTFMGIKLGKAKLHKRLRISRNTEKVYTFKLKSDLSDLNMMDAMNLLNSDKQGKIEIKGDLSVGKCFVKRKLPINYSDKVKLFK